MSVISLETDLVTHIIIYNLFYQLIKSKQDFLNIAFKELQLFSAMSEF